MRSKNEPEGRDWAGPTSACRRGPLSRARGNRSDYGAVMPVPSARPSKAVICCKTGKNGDPSKIPLERDGCDNSARDELAVKALAALEELDAHGNAGLPLQLRFGEALSNAKAVLKHGEFGPWCLNVLKRSLSWCSAHRRVYEDRADLEPALAWADATGHRWAHCRSVERLSVTGIDLERRHPHHSSAVGGLSPDFQRQ
jgi:hypothetical protein